MSHSVAWAASLLLAVLALQPAQAADEFIDSDAQTPSPIADRFYLQAGYFHATVKTDLRVDEPGEPLTGTGLSGATDLGFKPSENDGLVELMFRLRDRNRITADFLELDQSGTVTLDRPIIFGNQVFLAGDRVNTSVQWRTMGLTWTYALFQNDRFELGAGLGVRLMDLDVRGNVPARFASYETSIAGALPVPALETAVRITRRISVTAHGGYLHGTLNGTSGTLSDLRANVQFRIVPNLAVGAAYTMKQLRIDSRTDANPGLIGLRLRGPELFLRASF